MNKIEFLKAMRLERERWETLLAKVDETYMSEPGVAGDWSLKDLVAHVTAYERGLVQWLRAGLRGELLELPDLDHPDVDYRNALIFAENQNRPLQEVLAESRQVFEQLLGLVESLSEEELFNPERTEWFVRPRWHESRSLWSCIADDSYRHYQQHVPDVRAGLEKAENREIEATPYLLSDAAQVRMLRKLLLYWDGQWFLKTAESFGLDAAVDLNARVRASFGRIEMRTLLKSVAKPKADNLPDAMRLLEAYGEAFMGATLRAEFISVHSQRAEVIIRRCAAYEGAKRAGLPRVDQPCVACEGLWNAWLETLLPDVAVDVQYPLRQGKGDPHCHFILTIRTQDNSKTPANEKGPRLP